MIKHNTQKANFQFPSKMPKHMYVAIQQLGQREIMGDESNPQIVEYFKATTYHATDDDVPWCAAFVNWVLMVSGVARTKSAAALSYLDWGVRVKQGKYQFGDIVVWNHGRGRGHVSFFVGFDEATGDLLALGGNQGDEVNIGRFSPDSVAEVRRVKSAIESTTVITNAAALATTASATVIAAEAVTKANDAVTTAVTAADSSGVALDPILQTIISVLPPEWAVYATAAVAIGTQIYSIWRRVRRLDKSNI